MRMRIAPVLLVLALVSSGCRSRDRGADTVACMEAIFRIRGETIADSAIAS